MDYNDNDYEGHNLHLTGEESSKISSVLRPFALPKFDFDDSLHGHLRFDSLVENEVFLGIPSQEDNQWIEDFSRGSSAIDFSSSAAASCTLPRHNNVWSEATSSESVEMLLKAVGQEEMVQVGNITEESDNGDQSGRRPMEHDKIDVVDNNNPSLPPAEVEGQSSDVGDAQEYGIHSKETNYPLYGVCVDSKESNLSIADESFSIDLKNTSGGQDETKFVSEVHLQERVPALEVEFNNIASSSQEISVNIGESCHSNYSLVVKESISEQFEEHKEGLGGDATNNPISEMHYSLEKKKSLEEEHPVDIHTANSGKASIIHGEEETLSAADAFNEVAIDEPTSGTECQVAIDEPTSGTECLAVISSSMEISPMSKSFVASERTTVSFPEEGCLEVLGMKGSEEPEIAVSQQLDGSRCLIGDENIPGTKSSLEPPCTQSESSMLAEVTDNPREEKIESNIKHADGLDNSMESSLAGEEKLVTEGMSVIHGATLEQKKNLEDGDDVRALQAGSTQTCGEDTPCVQVNVDEQLHVRFTDTISNDKEKVLVANFTSEEVATINEVSGSKSDSSSGDHPVTNTEVEATEPMPSCVELVDCHEQNLPSSHDRDQGEEIKSEACRDPKASELKGSLEFSDEVVPMDTEKGAQLYCAAPGGTKSVEQSVILEEAPDTAISDAETEKLNDEMRPPAGASTLQVRSPGHLLTECSMEVGAEKSKGDNSFIVSVSSSVEETDKSNYLVAPLVSVADITQSHTNNKESPNRGNHGKVGEVVHSPVNVGGNAHPTEDGTFTFDIRPLGGQSATDSGKGLQSFPRSQARKPTSTGDGSPLPPGSMTKDSSTVKEISQATPAAEPPSVGSKGPSERKPRRGSGKSGKESVKGNVVKEKSLRLNEKGDKPSISPSPMRSGQLMTFESIGKQKGAFSVPTSSLPDLNTSVAPSTFFQQPFTDLQQVQLRAQIFVYGSLIQGAAPDEACMVSAFDGGRSIWESSWRACVEKIHGQKSQGVNTETPIQSRSGVKAPDQTNRHGFHQGEVLSSPALRAKNKSTPSQVVNPIIHLSSPLWNVATPSSDGLSSSSTARGGVFDYQAISPLYSYQTPPVRNFGMHATSWPSQAPFPVPWVASSQSSPFDFGSTMSVFPATEPVKLTPVKESSLPAASAPKHVSSAPPIHTGDSAVLVGTSALADLKKATASTTQVSADTKSRKRKKSFVSGDVVHISVSTSLVNTVSTSAVSDHSSKKVPALENLSPVPLVGHNQINPISTPFVSCHYSTSVAVATPSSFVPKSPANQFFPVVTASMSSDQLKRSDLSTDKRTLNLEAFGMIEEAKLQAEEAAAHATASIAHCQGVWSQLNQQKKSGLTSDAEAKLASAAAAIAAAAAVAKAAAAAAKVASNAAIQAKNMAEEAVAKSGAINTIEYNHITGSNSISPSSFVISTAREAARKRVEAASTATRQAENIDAIVKAAELAAEAVSYAGKIVSMGDPFSLNELVEAGPDGYWKIFGMPSAPSLKPNDNNKNKSLGDSVGKASSVFMNSRGQSDKYTRDTNLDAPPSQRDLCRRALDDHLNAEENTVVSTMHGANNSKHLEDKRVSESAITSGVVSELDVQTRSVSAHNLHEMTTNIKEGSVVEVLKDCGPLKKAWFSANILSLKNGDALVCYKELQSDEGSEPLKEWVPLGPEDGKSPILRIPHPMTSMQFEGTRKRRRSATKDYTWSVGDKVDVWVQDCWREGTIAEKHKKDATTFRVHFEAHEETVVAKAWQLRPTLIWSDGEWIEWCKPGQGSQGDTPLEKRLKLGSSVIEKGKMARNIDFVEIGAPTEETRLPLSSNEKVFNIGSTKDEIKPDMVRTVRPGLQREGSRVVFGVPKPGKKRKFMDVSKHYVSDKSGKTNVPHDSVKLSNLAPQVSGSRGLKNNSKPDLKEKTAVESKPRTFRTGKPPIPPGRALLQKGFTGNDGNESGKQNLTEFRSFSNIEETSGGTVEFSSQALPPENRKKASMRTTKSNRVDRGKLAPASVKTAKVEVSDKVVSEVSEPRRSNRRIQPTSRLLEGLQSSLIISKIPSSTLDKSHRSHSKGTSKGNNNRG